MKQLTINKIQIRRIADFFRVTCPKSRGFTIVEMIIYIAFFAVISILAINATIMTMKSFYVLRITQAVSQSATTALERMSREIRNAYDVDTVNSTLGTNPGSLTLKTKDATGLNTTIEFYVDLGSQLSLKEGAIDKGSLMVKTVTLDSLIFRLVTNTNSKAIKIEMTLRDSRSTPVKLVKFYDTIVLRGSIH